MWKRPGRPGGTDAGLPASLWAPERRALTIGLVLTITFMAAEALAVVTILPQVARDLGGIHLYGWVFSAFLLGSMVGIVAAGREADRSGPARPYVAGVVLFAAGLVVAGLAPSMIVLVCGRVLQGLGAGAVPAVAYVTIGRSFPEQLRARMMAVLSTAWVVPGVVGPVRPTCSAGDGSFWVSSPWCWSPVGSPFPDSSDWAGRHQRLRASTGWSTPCAPPSARD
jgi:MFS family permease